MAEDGGHLPGESGSLYQEILHQMSTGVQVWKLEDRADPGSFRLVFTNPAAVRHTGVAAEGRSMAESFPSLLKTGILELCRQAVVFGKPKNLGEIRYDVAPEAVLVEEAGDAALRRASQHAGPIHLLVTDVVMPRMMGPDLADRVRHFRPDINVLFVSGYADSRLVRSLSPLRNTQFLEKPFTEEALVRTVRSLLRGDSGV